MRITLLCVVFMLAVTHSACAKLRVVIGVNASNEQVTTQLREGMEARINSTDRYTVASGGADADLNISVTCVVVDSGTLAACDSDVTYFPYQNAPLSIALETAGRIVSAGAQNVSFIVNDLMDHFINGTTDVVLADRKTFLRKAVQTFCAAKPTECKIPRQ